MLGSCALPAPQLWKKTQTSEAPKAFFIPERQQAARRRPPTAEPLPGQPGLVYSPYTTPRKLVNITAFVAGDRALCPYSLEPFIIPQPTPQQDSSTLTPTADSTAPQAETNYPANSNPALETNPPAVTEVASQDLTSSLLPPPSGIPLGTWVEGIPGRVYSPFAPPHQQVDVSGLAPGVEVKCPYTGKIFRVPEYPSLGHSPSATPEMIAPLPEPPPENAAAPEAELPPPMPVPPIPEDESEMPSPAPDETPTESPEVPPTEEEPSSEAPRFGAKGDPVQLPTAVWAGSDRTKVQSPFGQPGELVDVTGRAAGEKVVCPYTGKPFLVPAP